MNKHRKKTPMEFLRSEKCKLERKSDALVDSIGNTLEYGRENIGSIVSVSIRETIYSLLPPFIQRMIVNKSTDSPEIEETGIKSSGIVSSIVDSILDLFPFFWKGKRGVFISCILKKLKNKFWC